MKYLIFDSEAEATAAEADISAGMGYSKPGINAATGEGQPDVLTVRWVFPSPDDTGVEAGADWRPSLTP